VHSEASDAPATGRRQSVAILIGALWVLCGAATRPGAPVTAAARTALYAQAPAGSASQAAAPSTAAIWVGRAPQMEAHLKNAEIVELEDIGTGVTKPQRAHLKPVEPFESLVWKPLPPGRRSGYWESYKSEVAAYELDKLLRMNMVPPAVERSIDGQQGAAILWVASIKSVKQSGGKMPGGAIWGRATRRMLTFDGLIGNPDRNAGNILIGPPGELILIDHSRAFTTDEKLPRKIERVDAELWRRIQALTRDDLVRVLGSWIDGDAVEAMLARRKQMADAIDKLVAKKGRAMVVVE
jgi:hypothetical protein